MTSFRSSSSPAVLCVSAMLLAAFALPAAGQQGEAATESGAHNMVRPRVPSLAQNGTVTPMPNGMLVRLGRVTLRVLALRDDVLRITAGMDGKMPEDASWAVLPAARAASVSVTHATAGAAFSTKQMKVQVDPATLRTTITDLAGNVLLRDSTAHVPKIHPGGGFTLWHDSPEDEHYFGMGDKTATFDHRNQSFTLWNMDHGLETTTDPEYKAIPYYLALRRGIACGVLYDDTWRTAFDFDKQERDTAIVNAEGGALDSYVFLGPSPRQVVEDYAWLTGTPPLPPRWALGYQQARYTYAPESYLRDIATHLRADHIPADVLWLDIDYQQDERPFTINQERFPDFPKLVADLHAEHFHLVPITDLHIAHTPGEDYAPYHIGHAADEFVHNPDGSEYVGKVWPGASVFPDFTRDNARQYWGALEKQFLAWGVDGFWNDMNEPSVFDGPGGTMPLTVVHRIEGSGFATRTATHAEIHNVYGMQQTRASYEGMLSFAPNERPFIMTRSSYAGGQRYAVTWTGDSGSTWAGMKVNTAVLENLGMSGFAFAGGDVGGFGFSAQPNLLTRWYELAAFQPIDRNHSPWDARPKEPWVDGPQQEQVRRKFIETRYRMLPYNYTLAEEASRNGLPMMRPLFLEFNQPGDAVPMDLHANGEFLWGPNVLVATPAEPENMQEYILNLPEGGWYDFWTGTPMPELDDAASRFNSAMGDARFAPMSAEDAKFMTEVKPLRITPQTDVLPVYVRAGTILPMQPLVQSTDEIPQGPLELRVYPPAQGGGACRGEIYTDDGHTLDYQRGVYFRQQFTCEAEEDAVRVKLGAPTGSYTPWWKQLAITVYDWRGTAANATDASGAKLSASLDSPSRTVQVIVPRSASAQEVRLTGRKPLDK